MEAAVPLALVAGAAKLRHAGALQPTEAVMAARLAASVAYPALLAGGALAAADALQLLRGGQQGQLLACGVAAATAVVSSGIRMALAANGNGMATRAEVGGGGGRGGRFGLPPRLCALSMALSSGGDCAIVWGSLVACASSTEGGWELACACGSFIGLVLAPLACRIPLVVFGGGGGGKGKREEEERGIAVHQDGGRYDGEWRARRKEGLGCYAYPSGASYEGEWRGDVKEGRGVYTFSSGALYAGEWRAGQQEGRGVRRLRDGRVVAGDWRAGKLGRAMPLNHCEGAVRGAFEAAREARSTALRVGETERGARERVFDACLSPPVIALGLAVVFLGLGGGNEAVAAAVRAVASSFVPLMMVCCGILWPGQVADVEKQIAVSLLTLRYVPALFLLAGLALALPKLGPTVATAVFPPLASTLLLPAPLLALPYALDENFEPTIPILVTVGSLLLSTGMLRALTWALQRQGQTTTHLAAGLAGAGAAAWSVAHLASARSQPLRMAGLGRGVQTSAWSQASSLLPRRRDNRAMPVNKGRYLYRRQLRRSGVLPPPPRCLAGRRSTHSTCSGRIHRFARASL